MSGVATNDSSVLCDVGNDDDSGLHSRYGPSQRRPRHRSRRRGQDCGSGFEAPTTGEPGPVLRHSRCWMYLLFRSGVWITRNIWQRNRMRMENRQENQKSRQIKKLRWLETLLFYSNSFRIFVVGQQWMCVMQAHVCREAAWFNFAHYWIFWGLKYLEIDPNISKYSTLALPATNY